MLRENEMKSFHFKNVKWNKCEYKKLGFNKKNKITCYLKKRLLQKQLLEIKWVYWLPDWILHVKERSRKERINSTYYYTDETKDNTKIR